MLIVTCALMAALVQHFPNELASTDGDWRWPLTPTPRVLRDYNPPPRPWLSGHRGVDLAARPGQPVFAAGAGRVGYAGRFAGRGVVTVLHGALRTTYLPVRPSVRPGQRVAAGARLGVVEDVRGHCGQVLCLHWGLRRGLTYLDPLWLLGRGPIRLLPVWHSPDPSGLSNAASPPGSSQPSPTDGSDATTQPHAAPSASPPSPSTERHPSTALASATSAGGGAVAGALLAFAISLTWRRLPTRRRLPPDVIDFTLERRRRHHPSAQ